MMKIIIPDRIQSVSLVLRGLHQLHGLRLVFSDKVKPALSCGFSCRRCDFSKNMPRRGIKNLLGSIKPEPIEMKLADPVLGILNKKFTNGVRIGPIKGEGVSPLRWISLGEVVGRKEGQIIAVRPDVIVNHVQDYRNAGPVAFIDETFRLVRLPIQCRWCK